MKSKTKTKEKLIITFTLIMALIVITCKIKGDELFRENRILEVKAKNMEAFNSYDDIVYNTMDSILQVPVDTISSKKCKRINNRITECNIYESKRHNSIDNGNVYNSDTVGVSSTITARVTAYSKKDSCHFQIINGSVYLNGEFLRHNPDRYPEDGCLNARDKIIKHGDIACPYDIPFGTKVKIEGFEDTFTCMDRTATWVQNEKGTTFDIWLGDTEEDYLRAKQFGRKYLKVKIL